MYGGQQAEQRRLDEFFGVVYGRMRRLFKVSAIALMLTLLQGSLTTVFSCAVIAFVIIGGGGVNGSAPTAESVQVALNGTCRNTAWRLDRQTDR